VDGLLLHCIGFGSLHLRFTVFAAEIRAKDHDEQIFDLYGNRQLWLVLAP